MATLHALAEGLEWFVRASPPAPGLFLYLAAAAIPVMLVHELGHTLVAVRRIGAPVSASGGSTRQLVRIRLRRLSFMVNELGRRADHERSASLSAARTSARDVALIALAGPLTSLVCLLAAEAGLWASHESGFLHNVFWAIAVVSVLGVFSILPLELQERPGGRRVRTDGRVALYAARAVRTLR
jgi:hypothetical protein